jgi:hypothetical protein
VSHLFWPEFHRQITDLAGEAERYLVVLVVHRRAGVEPDAEGLVPREGERQTARHEVALHHLAVHLQGAGAAFTESRAVVLPVEFERVLVRRERLLALPLHALQLNGVIGSGDGRYLISLGALLK